MILFKYTGPKVFTKIGGDKYYKKRWFKEQMEDGTYTRELAFFLKNRLSMVTKEIELKGISGNMQVKYTGHNGDSVPAISVNGRKFKRDEWVELPFDFNSIDRNGNDLFLTMGFKMRFEKAVQDNIYDCEKDAKILILRKFGGLGDILMQSLMFPDLKRQYPNMDVTYAIPKQFLPLFDNCSDIDHVIDKDEVETQIYRLISSGEFDLISDVSQCCVIHEVNSLKERGVIDKQRPDIWANHFGLNLNRHDTCIRITERETDFAKKYLKRDERKIIGFAPFSAARSRNYPFVQEVIDKLNALNYRVLLIHSDDTPYVNCEKITHQDLRTLGAIINELDLLIGVDSGPLHYAGILKKKVIGIYGVTDYNARLKYYDAVGIQGKCQSNRKPCWHMQLSFCMKDNIAGCMYIDPARIINVAEQLLAEVPKATLITNCRACDSPNLSKYLDLGLMPLVNQLEATKEKALAVDRFPLEVLFCENCGLSQLSYVVDPTLMFSNYPYRSGISQTFVNHCDFLADYYYKTFNLKDGDYVLDIASNDGTLLKSFKAKGLKVLGIEPASNLAQIANDAQIETIGSFWNEVLAENIKTNYGKMKLIFGTNIFAHVHDVVGFLTSARMCLAEDGRIVLEFPYLMNLIRGNAFDTIYHEHLSYFTVKPLQILAEKCGLIISDIIEDSVHGGSIRIEFTLRKDKQYQGNRIKLFQGVEKIDGCGDFAFYKKFGEHNSDLIADIKEKLNSLKSSGHTIAAFGAAAKGNILLNAIGADSNLISYIVDDTPEKIGKFAPGTGIPIVSREELKNNPPDYLLILPWNFKDEIIANTSDIYKGKYIVALPNMEVISNSIANRISKICITTTFDKNYKEAGKTLFNSIRRHTDCTGIDFKVITTDIDVVNELGEENCHFVDKEIRARYKDVKYYKDLPFERYESSWHRFEMFNMTDYDRVICIDSDCICIEDISYLFSNELDQYDLISVEDHIVSKSFTKSVPELTKLGLNLTGMMDRRKRGEIDIQPALLVANKSILDGKWYRRLLEFANTSEFIYAIDEGILNTFVYADGLKIKLLPLEWDYQDVYETHIPELPIPTNPIIVHCQQSKPFKKEKSQIDQRLIRWHDKWWEESKPIPKTLIVIIVWNRFENLKRWISCWNQCFQMNAELVIVHNLESDNERYSQLCKDNKIVYVPRENKGFDIGAFQDVCKERLPNFPNDWNNLIWITDDCIPMSKDFVKHFLNKLSDTEIPCYEISDEVKRHIRTTGFMVTKEISKKLTFPKDPMENREDCYHFEHKSKTAFLEQLVSMGKKPVMVEGDLKLSPLWDFGVRANLNLMNKHEEVFPPVKLITSEIVVDSILDKMAIKHKADKSSQFNNFAVKYDKILSPFRNSYKSVLEIGICQGNSLRMWVDYFPNAIIHGVDIPNAEIHGVNLEAALKDCKAYSDKIVFHMVDQSDEAQLKNLEQFSPFDFIVDDGSHLWGDQILTFQTLFPYLRKGGIYIVEDTCTSYWKEYKNNSISCIDYFKTLVDEVNFKGNRGSIPENPPKDFGAWEKGWHRREDCQKVLPLFESIQFFNGFIVVFKR
jgi:ADP-heptose:LPS heptosyltransferase/lipopolysaccharide biosynthesis glycosyltransferase